MPEVKRCPKCGRLSFDYDYSRRAWACVWRDCPYVEFVDRTGRITRAYYGAREVNVADWENEDWAFERRGWVR